MTTTIRNAGNTKFRIGLLLVGIAAAIASVMALQNCRTSITTDKVTSVKISEHTFTLEVAADPETRFLGLSGREHIEDDGGMIFVFRNPSLQSFVMRDCPIDIDIMYLDANGKVLTTHEMKAEDPQRPDESDTDYNARLRKYSSRYSNTQFVIELRAGKMAEIGAKEGDQVTLDMAGLKKLAS